jgi:hypothetical protein
LFVRSRRRDRAQLSPNQNDYFQIAGEHIEARLVTLLALELFRLSGLPPTESGYAEFWRSHLFVVTPQHLQRMNVRRLLHRAGFPERHIFVDTVEKMQGQQADTVIGPLFRSFLSLISE